MCGGLLPHDSDCNVRPIIFIKSGICLFQFFRSMESLHAKDQGVKIETLYLLAGQAGIDLRALAKKEDFGQTERECFATFAILPRGKREVENTKIVVNKGEVENIDVSFANGKMAKVANNGERAENGYTFSDKLVVGGLDCIMRAVYDLYHEAPAKCDTMLLAVCNVVGA